MCPLIDPPVSLTLMKPFSVLTNITMQKMHAKWKQIILRSATR